MVDIQAPRVQQRRHFSNPPNLLIQSDASLQGCGAVNNGTKTGGHWSAEEKHQHINNLELQAGTFAVQTFTKGMGNIQVLLQMDNQSAVGYYQQDGEDPLTVLIPTRLQSVALVP